MKKWNFGSAILIEIKALKLNQPPMGNLLKLQLFLHCLCFFQCKTASRGGPFIFFAAGSVAVTTAVYTAACIIF